MRVVRHLAFALLALGITVGSAQAALITLNYNFSATGFTPVAPVDPVTGSFSIMFDNSSDLTNVSAGLSLTNLNIALGSTPAFDYRAASDFVRIGGLENGVIGVGAMSSDFVLILFNVSTNPTFFVLAYTTPSIEIGAFQSNSGTLTPSSAPVPEAATFSLFALGLAGIAARRWRQREAS